MDDLGSKVGDPEYIRVCLQYRELCKECESLTARRASVAELVEAIEWKCRRLGQLIRDLKTDN